MNISPSAVVRALMFPSHHKPSSYLYQQCDLSGRTVCSVCSSDGTSPRAARSCSWVLENALRELEKIPALRRLCSPDGIWVGGVAVLIGRADLTEKNMRVREAEAPFPSPMMEGCDGDDDDYDDDGDVVVTLAYFLEM